MFAGSLDLSVLMYRPTQKKAVTIKRCGSYWRFVTLHLVITCSFSSSNTVAMAILFQLMKITGDLIQC